MLGIFPIHSKRVAENCRSFFKGDAVLLEIAQGLCGVPREHINVYTLITTVCQLWAGSEALFFGGWGIDVVDAEGGEFGAEAVDVEAEFAGAKALAGALFFFAALEGELGDKVGGLRWNNDDAVLVGDNDIAGMDHRAGAHHVDIHGAGGGLDGSLGGDGFGPNGKVHCGEVGAIANAGINDKTGDAVSAAGDGQQLAEHAVGGFGRSGDDQDIAGAADFDGSVNHQVVTGMAGDGDCWTGQARARVERAHVRTHQTGAALRFVDGGDAEFAKLGDHVGGRTGDLANDLRFHAASSIC